MAHMPPQPLIEEGRSRDVPLQGDLSVALSERVTPHHLPWKFPSRLSLDAKVPPTPPTPEVSDVTSLEFGWRGCV